MAVSGRDDCPECQLFKRESERTTRVLVEFEKTYEGMAKDAAYSQRYQALDADNLDVKRKWFAHKAAHEAGKV